MRSRLALCALALFTVAANDAPTPPKLRLPAGVRPTHYALDLSRAGGADLLGHRHHRFARRAPTSVVWLNATELAIDGAEVRSAGAWRRRGSCPAAKTSSASSPRDRSTRARRSWWCASRQDRRREEPRLYRVAEATPDDWYAYTFFEPTDARRAFPCFDEPAYKVPWKLTLHVPKAQVALGNAPVASESDEPGGMKAVTLEDSKPLPSYLVAFVVGPFELVDGGRAGRANTPIRFIVPRGRAAETRYAQGGDAAHRCRAREVLRHALSVRQARRRRGAALLGHDGASRHRRARPAAHADQADRRGAASQGVLRQHRHSRAGALLVRRLRHLPLVERRLAQRGARHLGRRQSHRRARAVVEVRARAQRRRRRCPPTDSRRCRRSACPSRPRTPSRTRSTTTSPTPRARRCCT